MSYLKTAVEARLSPAALDARQFGARTAATVAALLPDLGPALRADLFGRLGGIYARVHYRRLGNLARRPATGVLKDAFRAGIRSITEQEN